MYQEKGLVNFSHPAHHKNLLPLCKNCHDQFGANIPGWVIIPSDLASLLNMRSKTTKTVLQLLLPDKLCLSAQSRLLKKYVNVSILFCINYFYCLMYSRFYILDILFFGTLGAKSLGEKLGLEVRPLRSLKLFTEPSTLWLVYPLACGRNSRSRKRSWRRRRIFALGPSSSSSDKIN